MTAPAASAYDLVRPGGLTRIAGSPRGREVGRFLRLVLVVGAAMAVGYMLVKGHERDAILMSVLPLVLWLLTRPVISLVLFGASIPAIVSLTGSGTAGSGYNVGPSDLLLLIAGAAIALEYAAFRGVSMLRPLRVVSPMVYAYSAIMVALLTVHHSVHDLAKTGQRFELFLLPLIVGAYVSVIGWHLRVLQVYVFACMGLAVVFPLHSFGMQHNPVGQMIANAILVVVAVPAFRRLLPCLVVLVPGLLLTGSRGAILAGLAGVVMIAVASGFRSRLIVTRVLPIAALAAGTFVLVAPSLQHRLTSYSSSPKTAGGYAIHVRHEYTRDAKRIIAAHPWTGVGVGNYFTGGIPGAAQTTDPHDVILLEAAEGGYLFAAAFVFLIVGLLVVLVRMKQVDVAAAAAGVLLATVVHGLVDVYWVRGTPLLGFLLVGMACGGLARSRAPSQPA